ncbi:hypothetical protein CDCA_CDCA06G1760 [Cyanidium caldarium]|uniref:Nudix hydrolase domain-containing protein n=1 Tax=Cyanidium caldarium TaxID=2771 RepID=A0AAV9IUE9_CYACA|nr:hypothetical protein CDCA_CDCA06G1760 [Cyanidium caldarium]
MRNGAKSTHPAVMGAPLWIARAFSRQRRADAERSDAPSTGGSVTERTIHHSAGHYVASVRTRQLLDAMEERLATLPLRTETVPHDPTVTAPNAAVLVLLCRPHGGSPATGEELAFALTERSKTVRTHRGEMSFPGGKLRQGDTSVLQTALRETCEEIGLEPRHVRVLGQFHEYRPLLQSSNLRVATFIGYMNDCVDPSALRVNPQEVKNLFIVPQRLFRLCRHLTSNTDARTPECSTTSDEHGKVPCTAIPAGNAADASNGVHEAAELPTENGTIYFALPHHCTGGKLVWGMTARIIDEVMQFMAECS